PVLQCLARYLPSVPTRRSSDLEAAACGVPVVGAGVGGLLSLVDDGRTGVLIGERDPHQYAAAIGTLLDDPSIAATMGRAAHQRADRKSTRLNSSHVSISYAVFC